MKKLTILFLFCLPLLTHAKSIKHVRVIWQENPSHESYIAWTTKGLFRRKKTRVYYDTVPRRGVLKNYRYTIKPYTKKRIPHSISFIYGAKLTNLTPNTKYYFVVKKGKRISREYHFITAPSGNTPFELLVGGDTRGNRQKRREMNVLLRRILQKNPDIYALSHGGDYVGNGFSWKQWKKWLTDIELTTTNKGRILPIIPTRGNHEISRLHYNSIWLNPGVSRYKNYYTTKIGKLSLITLDSNVIVGGKQKKWLKNELIKASQDQRWIIVNYHRALYPAVKKPGRAKKHWVPLFEKYQVDLALESDGHTLKRTAPIYNGRVDFQKGITYVGEGGLGVKQRVAKKAFKWYFQSPGYALSAHHVLKLRVTPQKMTYTVHLEDGRIYDKMILTPRLRKINL